MSGFDIVVIGAGPAGIAAASRAAENGARVVVIDDNPAIHDDFRKILGANAERRGVSAAGKLPGVDQGRDRSERRGLDRGQASESAQSADEACAGHVESNEAEARVGLSDSPSEAAIQAGGAEA